MEEIIESLRNEARESPYAADRMEAVEGLDEVYAEAERDTKEDILRTWATIARESTHREERDQARELLVTRANDGDEVATERAVRTLCRIAIESKFSDDREAAIKRLRDLRSRGLPGRLRDRVRETFLEISTEGTYSAERDLARDGLAEMIGAGDTSDPTPPELEPGVEIGEETTGGTAKRDSDSTVQYLATSLAEHLEASRDDPTAAKRRVSELAAFVDQYEVSDAEYGSILEELDDLESVLGTVPTGGDLDDDRQQQIATLAQETKRLYLRADPV